jgi:hypothetical protein
VKRRNAFTVLEVMLAAALFLVLSVALLNLFRYASRAALQGSTRAGLVQQTNAACHRFAREVERSLYESTSCSASIFSCLSAVDQSGRFLYDAPTRQPRWQRYLVFYVDTVHRQFRLRSVPVTGTATETSPAPIEMFPPAAPLSSYASGGQAIAQEIYACEFRVNPEGLVQFWVGGEARRRDRAQPEVFVQSTTVKFRN